MPKLPVNPNIGLNFDESSLKTIYFAGGCFWGTQAYLARIKGVFSTETGYANGTTKNPSYEEVCRNNTGHAETVKVIYSPDHISLSDLCSAYFSIIDPTSLNRQGMDIGTQYRTGVYYTDAGDLSELKAFFDAQREKYAKAIVVELRPLENYYPAEEYHQDYLEKNPNGYCHINF